MAMGAATRRGDSLEISGDGRPEDGARGLQVLLDAGWRFTAVTCYNDLTALGLLAEAARRGIRVPEDLSVVGFDDIPLSAFSIPPLTTIRQPKSEMGRVAVETCAEAIDSQNTGNRTLEGQLVVRGSAAAPRPM
jgi:DNA-binding LacI/PurR family transcriptional regulator